MGNHEIKVCPFTKELCTPDCTIQTAHKLAEGYIDHRNSIEKTSKIIPFKTFTNILKRVPRLRKAAKSSCPLLTSKNKA